jgi:hypothetical protein
MNTLALRFGLPDELAALIDTGVLEITGQHDAEKTLHLVVPSLWQKDRKGRIKIVSITWIHPDCNAQFCHYYHLAPGDLPNFYVNEENSEGPDEPIDVNDVDELPRSRAPVFTPWDEAHNLIPPSLVQQGFPAA